jgi:hypothetical protein
MFEDDDAVRHSSEVEEVRKGREGKHAREEFEVEVLGIGWACRKSTRHWKGRSQV